MKWAHAPSLHRVPPCVHGYTVMFVDYAGRTVPIYGATCEEAYRATLFVGALGASGYAYAEAMRTASLPDWLGSHVRMLES